MKTHSEQSSPYKADMNKLQDACPGVELGSADRASLQELHTISNIGFWYLDPTASLPRASKPTRIHVISYVPRSAVLAEPAGVTPKIRLNNI